MSERGEDDSDDNNNNNNVISLLSQENNTILFCLKILINSLVIFPVNKHIFLSIFTLTNLPLSFLLFSFSLSAQPIKARVYSLEALARLAPTRFEARHLWKESRADALSLLHLRLCYFLPCYLLSLVAAVSAIHSAHSAVHGKRFSLLIAGSHIRLTWKRPLVTSICIYAVFALYSQVIFYLTVIMGTTPRSVFLIWVFGSVFELYLMAISGVGLVASVLEDRIGFDAIRFGSDLIEGRRACGWLLSGWFIFISGWIGRGWHKLIMDGHDLRNMNWTVMMTSWEKMGLICLYGIEMLWSFTVTTIFYCECRKRHSIRTENDIEEVTA
ncbi:uncharacterized protein LOC123194942 [Mangifera indica]|uniref:uncharacterized protein LOC123194942 n=1 Tax=Mangifera indica TaxID=29780 RepID=UPI001CFAFDBC|nr:uncharacterized protein LOC123194942 [Mangifera indica]